MYEIMELIFWLLVHPVEFINDIKKIPYLIFKRFGGAFYSAVP